MKYFLAISLIICGSLSAKDKEIYSVSVPDKALGIDDTMEKLLKDIENSNDNVELYIIATKIEEAIKSSLNNIQEKLQRYDVDDIKVNPLTLENVGTLTIKKLGMKGISKFQYDVKVKMQSILKIILDCEIRWESTPFHLVLDHDMDVENPNSELAWLNGPGKIDFTLKDTFLGLHFTLKNTKPNISEVTLNVGPETRFAKFQLGETDLKKTMNDLFTNEDMHNIVTILLGELIKEVAKRLLERPKSTDIGSFITQVKDPEFIKHVITMMDRLYKM